MDQPRRVLNLILCWHMHQPDYRRYDSREFALPWTYLHATKDYTDMAWHLEQNPGMRAVVNFVPILLEQLEDYADSSAPAPYATPCCGSWRGRTCRRSPRPNGISSWTAASAAITPA